MPSLSEVIAQNRDTFSKLAIYSAAMFVFGIGSFLLVARTAVGGAHCGVTDGPCLS